MRDRSLTDEQRAARRRYARQHRAQQSEKQKQANRDRARQRRAQQSDEQKLANRDRARQRARQRRAAMTDEQKEVERQRRRQRHSPHYQSALLRADGTCNPVNAHYIGRLSERCPYEGCRALRFPGETLKSLCCHGGKAVLPPLTPMPAFLYGLYLGRAALSPEQLASLSPAQCRLLEDPSITSHFREHIRSYNSALGLASLTFSQEELSGRGPPIIRVHGQMHRRLPSCPAPDVQLRPVADDPTIIAQWVNRGDCHPRPQEQYAQLYVYSPADAAQQRLNHRANGGLRRDLLMELHELLLSSHAYAQSYRLMYESMCAHPQSITDIVMELAENREQPRRYNRPSELAANDVAAIVIQPGSGGHSGMVESDSRRARLITVDRRDGQCLQSLPSHSSLCDPLIYPLLFASGDNGWVMGSKHSRAARTATVSAQPDAEHQGEDAPPQGALAFVDLEAAVDDGDDDDGDGRAGRRLQRDRLTMQQFYSSRLACRSLTPSPVEMLYFCGRLSQQYIVDAFVKVEESRLLFIRLHQDKLRVETYRGLQDWMHQARSGLPSSEQVGRPVILPSSFTGGPRSMYQHYQDSMSIARRFGRPDLFITFTCNPRWPEIVEHITAPQTRSERPDIVDRVFLSKLREFLDDLTSHQRFGRVVAYTAVIEFQKRGLPHSHIVVTLADACKPRDISVIDRMVSAELPDPRVSPELHAIVRQHMIHSCSARCLTDGRCTSTITPSPKTTCHR